LFDIPRCFAYLDSLDPRLTPIDAPPKRDVAPTPHDEILRSRVNSVSSFLSILLDIRYNPLREKAVSILHELEEMRRQRAAQKGQ